MRVHMLMNRSPKARLLVALAIASSMVAGLGVIIFLLFRGAHFAPEPTERAPAPLPEVQRNSPKDIHSHASDVLNIRAALDSGWESVGDYQPPPPEVKVLGELGPDASWSQYPRSSWNLVSRFRLRPDSIRAEELLRHVEVNPADTYVELLHRSLLEALCNYFAPRLREAQELVSRAHAAEVPQLMRAGKTTAFNLVTQREAGGGVTIAIPRDIDTNPDGSEVLAVSFPSAGEAQGLRAPKSLMPLTQEAEQYRRFLAAEFGGHVMNWAANAGINSFHNAIQVVEALSAEAIRKPTRTAR